MSTINEIQDEIIEEFSMFEDWTDKYEYIIDLGKHLPPMDEKYKTDENRVHGCQSQVWLEPYKEGDKLCFHADSDAFITKGVIGLLVKVLSGQKPEDIYNADLYFIKDTGLQAHLSPNRANGLVNMIKTLKNYALAFQSKEVG